MFSSDKNIIKSLRKVACRISIAFSHRESGEKAIFIMPLPPNPQAFANLDLNWVRTKGKRGIFHLAQAKPTRIF